MIDGTIWTVVSLGAANWGLVRVANTDLISDVLGLGTEAANVAFIAIGIAGLLNLYAIGREVAA